MSDQWMTSIDYAENWKARALKAEAECAELGESMRQVGIEQFEANAARLRAETEIERLAGNALHERGLRLKAEEALERCNEHRRLMQEFNESITAKNVAHINRFIRAEEALRGTFEAINDDDISGAYLILRTYLAALSEKGDV